MAKAAMTFSEYELKLRNDIEHTKKILILKVKAYYRTQKVRVQMMNALKLKADGTPFKGVVRKEDEFMDPGEKMNLETLTKRYIQDETDMEKDIKDLVERFPIYTQFLSKVRGIGPMMAGVLISTIDIAVNENRSCNKKMTTASSILGYAGIHPSLVKGFKSVKVGCLIDINGVDVKSDGKKNPDPVKAEFNQITEKEYAQAMKYLEAIRAGKTPARTPKWLPKEGAEYVACPISKEEAKKAKKERGLKITSAMIRTNVLIPGDKPTVGWKIPYNKFLKTKLVGVIGSGMVRAGGHYAYYYYNKSQQLEQKNKLIEDGEIEGVKLKPKHIYNQAVRYMMKMFVRDLYVQWRTIEGLPVRDPYELEYLGIKHNSLTLDELNDRFKPYEILRKQRKDAKGQTDDDDDFEEAVDE